VLGILRRGNKGPVAQWLEQGTHNPSVAGSIPARPTLSTSTIAARDSILAAVAAVVALAYRGRVQAVRRVIVTVLVAAALVAACSGGSHKAEPPKPTKPARAPADEFAVVLDDAGLHVPRSRRPAGSYLVSFVDRRSRKGVNQGVAVAISPSGPPIVLFKVSAGARCTEVLLANESAQVVINGVVQWKRSSSLNIATSKSYPTPAT
jgi:hypothetical protein